MVYYQDTKLFAIYESNRLIGFVALYVGEQHPQIINFLIADTFQRRGYGIAAAKACIAYLRQEFKARDISLPVDHENISAQRFWQKVGFSFSDSVEEGYVFMRLQLGADTTN